MKRIDPNLIKHLEWSPEDDDHSALPPNPVDRTLKFSIEEILNGSEFYNTKLNIALQETEDYAGEEGIVVSMPELIAAKIKADKTHKFWNKYYTVQSEENIGIDVNGKILDRGESALVVVHGGGILTSERIGRAYDEGLIGGSAKYTQEEFSNLLRGELPDGNSIRLYSIDDLKRSSPIERKYGVVIPYGLARETKSGYHGKDEFMRNPLVIARFGGMENIEKYFDLAKSSDGNVGCWHRFSDQNLNIPEGRVLFLFNGCNGLYGDNYLNNNGRFVGVAPKVHGEER